MHITSLMSPYLARHPISRTAISPSTSPRKLKNGQNFLKIISHANFLAETNSQYHLTSPSSSQRPGASQGIFFWLSYNLYLNYITADVEKVWSHVRTFRGIVASYSQPQPFLEDPPPSFNHLADRYFETHGYQAATLFNIGRIFAECSGDGDAFVQCLADRGTAWTEAEWIWEILNNP
jgi:hypothetical protein